MNAKKILGFTLLLGSLAVARPQSPAYAQRRMSISFHNRCNRPIQLAVRYKNADSNNWVTRGWYQFVGNENSVIQTNTSNRYFYYYAETTDSGTRLTWGGNDTTGVVSGRTLNMRQVDTGDHWSWTQSLTCTGNSPTPPQPARPRFPVSHRQEREVKAGVYTTTNVTVTADGRVYGETHSRTNNLISGSHVTTRIFLVDSGGTVFASSGDMACGVAGRMDASGSSNRRCQFDFTVNGVDRLHAIGIQQWDRNKGINDYINFFNTAEGRGLLCAGAVAVTASSAGAAAGSLAACGSNYVVNRGSQQ